MNNICTILVSSCDRYECTWEPFFKLMHKYWPSCNYPIVLNTETKSYSDFGVKTVNSGQMSWSNRLKNTLLQIDTEYVLFMLDDFFIQGYVKDNLIAAYLETMTADKNINAIYLKHITHHNTPSEKYPSLNQIDPAKKYSFNFQACIWRKDVLYTMLPDNVSAWDIEEEMTISQFSDGEFYCVKTGTFSDCTLDPIPYLWALQEGYGICKSKWLWNNKKFFKKEGIDVDYTTLPILSRGQYIKDTYLNFDYIFNVFRHFLS